MARLRPKERDEEYEKFLREIELEEVYNIMQNDMRQLMHGRPYDQKKLADEFESKLRALNIKYEVKEQETKDDEEETVDVITE